METIFNNPRAQSPFWLCTPNHSLVVSIDAFPLLWAESQIKTGAGIGRNDMDNYPLCAYPLPLLGDDAADQPLARKVRNLKWFGNPVMWLKGDVLRAHPFPVEEYEDKRNEFNEEIALRIAIQLESSGFYNATNGAWHDVSNDLASLDLNKPSDRDRVRQWQRGGSDSLLDACDVGTIMQCSVSVREAIGVVNDMFGPALLVSGVMGANGLINDIDRVLSTKLDEDLTVYTLLVSRLGMQYAGSIMTDEQEAQWQSWVGDLSPLRVSSEPLCSRIAVSYLTDMMMMLSQVVGEYYDIIDDAWKDIYEFRKEISKAS
ncbi:hypothetical protein [Ferrimicrobium acidiphilum]|jgi:hypothetical protein|uniref:hypothetical protein n=1 Tax=Ferrimicrobium acidiphilum TaxID=121039 RepID=UPI0023F4D080|nr:hypothetical protein [Ferrimicrobium acidiphilum]